jgi:hypothetical protein
MNKEQADQILIDLWLEKASDALALRSLNTPRGIWLSR